MFPVPLEATQPDERRWKLTAAAHDLVRQHFGVADFLHDAVLSVPSRPSPSRCFCSHTEKSLSRHVWRGRYPSRRVARPCETSDIKPSRRAFKGTSGKCRLIRTGVSTVEQ